MTHAMVIVAVHLDRDGKPLRFRVESESVPLALQSLNVAYQIRGGKNPARRCAI
jgi:hypothetical protein